jgi:hypothetical protein
MWPVIVIIAQLTAAQISAAKATYHKLPDVTQHEASVKPPKDAQRIDVSARIRSASFGHRTWLLVAPDGKQLWVEYGPSTNTKGGLYGPFPVDAPAPAKPTK